IPANVDNHWFKLFLGVGIQALLNYSVRAREALGVGQVQQPGGAQDLGQDLTRGANQGGQQLLQRFNVRPTLSQDFAYPVTIQFMRNVSFQTKATIITK